jgi:hypothetical protein
MNKYAFNVPNVRILVEAEDEQDAMVKIHEVEGFFHNIEPDGLSFLIRRFEGEPELLRTETGFSEWPSVILELLGHRRLGGSVREVQFAGMPFPLVPWLFRIVLASLAFCIVWFGLPWLLALAGLAWPLPIILLIACLAHLAVLSYPMAATTPGDSPVAFS